MQISGYEFPDGLYYDELHSWIKVDGNVVTQGLTEFGQAIVDETAKWKKVVEFSGAKLD